MDSGAERSGGKGKRGSKGGVRTVRSVERAAEIMDALLMAGPRGKRVNELSAELGLHKTTVVRLLQTLVVIGAIRRNKATERYCWEPLAWLTLMRGVREAVAAHDALLRPLRDLVEATGMTAILGRPDQEGHNLRLVVRVLPDEPVQVDPGRIRSAPMYAVAGGKAYLASLPEGELEKWMKQGLPRITGRTITSPEVLRQELAQVRERGYAVAPGEFYPDAGSVAVAVLDETGRVVGGLDLVGPTRRLTPESIRRWVPLLQEAAERASRLLYAASGRIAAAVGQGGSAPLDVGARGRSSRP